MFDLSFLDSYKEVFESHLRKRIPLIGEKNLLRDACEYALLNGGKRLRPIIVLLVAEGLGMKREVYLPALSVEFFHTASLIVDDLPCMDDDDKRRNQPTLHKVFGEAVALLASYALITEGFHLISQSSKRFFETSKDSDQVGMIALECASKAAGFSGATGGQFLDLFCHKGKVGKLKEAIRKKTGTLFEVAFTFGFLFGGGQLSLIDELKKGAYHFGMAFQIADDVYDLEQDRRGKKPLNLALVLGVEAATFLFEKEIKAFEAQMKKLEIFNLKFELLSRFLSDQVKARTSSSCN